MQRKVELGPIEDGGDAIVCAHLAWLWTNRPGAMKVSADVAGGCIGLRHRHRRLPAARQDGVEDARD